MSEWRLCPETAGPFNGISTALLLPLLKSNHRLAWLVNTNILCLLTTHHMTVWVEAIEQTDIYCCLVWLPSCEVIQHSQVAALYLTEKTLE